MCDDRKQKPKKANKQIEKQRQREEEKKINGEEEEEKMFESLECLIFVTNKNPL